MTWINQIALRYFFSRKKNLFTNLSTKLSILSVMFSTSIMILILSVVHGFHDYCTNKIIKTDGHFYIYDEKYSFEYKDILEKIPQNIKAIPVLQSYAIINQKNNFLNVVLSGFEKEKASEFGNFDINSDKPKVIIGSSLAYSMKLKKGDLFEIIVPRFVPAPLKILPDNIVCVVSDIRQSFNEYEENMIIFQINDLQKILNLNHQASKIICFSQSNKKSYKDMKEIKKLFENKEVLHWEKANKFFLETLKMEKSMVIIILICMILLSVLCIMFSIILLISIKKREIAILKILGAKKLDIIEIFTKISLIITAIGSFLGFFLGILLTNKINSLSHFVERIFKIPFAKDSLLFFPEIPVSIHIFDIVLIILLNFFISFFASLYTSYKAISIDALNNL